MREIKFRAWLKDDKTMEFVDIIDWNFESISFSKLIPIKESNPEYDEIEVRFKEVELMQYTGLKDRNGKEIYEGDIVKNIVTLCVGEILWVKAYCRYGLKEAIFPNSTKPIVDCTMAQRYEVIGNIYENSELLNNGE